MNSHRLGKILLIASSSLINCWFLKPFCVLYGASRIDTCILAPIARNHASALESIACTTGWIAGRTVLWGTSWHCTSTNRCLRLRNLNQSGLASCECKLGALHFTSTFWHVQLSETLQQQPSENACFPFSLSGPVKWPDRYEKATGPRRWLSCSYTIW